MKMSKKARSMAAVLAVMALTAGVSGVQAERVEVQGSLAGGYVDSDEMGTTACAGNSECMVRWQ